MKREILINGSQRETRVAILEDDRLVELLVDRPDHRRTVGDIYLGRVEAVLPGIQAAFVDIGQEKSAFLHASDLLEPDEDDEEPSEEDADELVGEGGEAGDSGAGDSGDEASSGERQWRGRRKRNGNGNGGNGEPRQREVDHGLMSVSAPGFGSRSRSSRRISRSTISSNRPCVSARAKRSIIGAARASRTRLTAR